MTRIKKRRTGKKKTSDNKKLAAGRRHARPKPARVQESEVAEVTEKKIRSYAKPTKADKPAAAPRKLIKPKVQAPIKKSAMSGRIRTAKTDRPAAAPKKAMTDGKTRTAAPKKGITSGKARPANNAPKSKPRPKH